MFIWSSFFPIPCPCPCYYPSLPSLTIPGLTKPIEKSNLSLVFVSRFLIGTVILIHLCIAHGTSGALGTELNIWNRIHMPHKAKNIFLLALYGKKLQTHDLSHWFKLMTENILWELAVLWTNNDLQKLKSIISINMVLYIEG